MQSHISPYLPTPMSQRLALPQNSNVLLHNGQQYVCGVLVKVKQLALWEKERKKVLIL